MSEYIRCLADNRIDFSVLSDLTDQDLKDLGVVLGDRRKMLRAIPKLASATLPAPETSPNAEPKPHNAAERRYLTVLLCDLVGSTALAARLDPEDVGGVISSYLARVSATVSRFRAHPAHSLTHPVLIY